MSTTSLPAAAARPPEIRSFPRPDTALARVIGDPVYRESFHRRLQSSNKFVVFFYRLGLLPLLGVGKSTMLLFTTGRTSHKRRIFPVGYFRLGGEIYMISGWGKASNWYKNLQADPRSLHLQVGFRSFPAQSHVIETPAEVLGLLRRLVLESPDIATRLLGWDPNIDNVASADFSPLKGKVIFVRFVPRPVGGV
jgi:deazaflavin-dependent oxidoreductase (nitroreductase family)